MSVDRRDFIKVTGLTALGIVCEPGKFALAEKVAGQPLKAGRWAMVIDLSKCLKEEGCNECQKACHYIHNVPEITGDKKAEHEVKWIWKQTYEDSFPEQEHKYISEEIKEKEVVLLCNHCDNPPCVRVCPTKATWKRGDGLVMMDQHRCVGCRFCIAACPYGSRSFNWVDPRPFIKNINKKYPTRTKGVVEKCNFCSERLAKGEIPACVEACKEKALVFGDINQNDSEVRHLLETNYSVRRKPSLGTNPEVYYIISK